MLKKIIIVLLFSIIFLGQVLAQDGEGSNTTVETTQTTVIHNGATPLQMDDYDIEANSLENIGIFDEDVNPEDIESEAILSSVYTVGDIQIHRYVIDLLGDGTYVKYHGIIEDNIVILFFNPEYDMDYEDLIYAFEYSKRVQIANGIVVLIDTDSDHEFKNYEMSESEKFVISRVTKKGKLGVFSKVKATFKK